MWTHFYPAKTPTFDMASLTESNTVGGDALPSSRIHVVASKTLIIALVTLGIAFFCALLFIPVGIITGIISGILVIAIAKKFWSDNRQILFRSKLSDSLFAIPRALFLFVPFAILLLPGIAITLAVDFVLDEGVKWLDHVAAPKVEKVLQPYPWYNPGKYIFGSLQEVKVIKEAPIYLRVTVVTLRHFLVLVHWYFVLYLGFLVIRLLLFFYAKAFVSGGGQIAFSLRKLPNND